MSADEFQDGAQEWERGWWGDCLLTFGEEAKQLTYAVLMGLTNEPWMGKWPCYDLQNRTVVDIGGGPTSMLLKCRNRGGGCVVVDPCDYPKWVASRYKHAGITVARRGGEDFTAHGSSVGFDEAWLYNCLQHTIDPAAILREARAAADTLRIAEWLNTGVAPGHPWTFTGPQLLGLLRDAGWDTAGISIRFVNENGAYGDVLHGTAT